MLSAVAGPKAPGPKYGQPVAPNLNVRTLCPNCRSDPPNIVEEYSKGDLVCGDCGTILGDRIVDTRSEWRTFAGDEGGDDPSRVGDAGDPLLGDLLQTHINQGGGRNGEAQKLARAASRIASTTNGATSMAALQAAFGRITEKCETMQLPSKVTNIAKHIYKIADESRLIRGKNEMALVAACIVLASRSAKVDRSLVEVAKATHVPKKELGRVLNLTKDIIRKSKTGLNTSSNASDSTLANSEQSTDASLARFVNFLDLGHGVHNAAKYIANAASAKTEIDGRSPLSIAAGVLYFTCVLFGKEVTARNIAELAKISESTTKLVCKLIAQKLDDVIRPEWKAQHDKGYNDLASLGKISKRAKSESPLAALPSPKVEDGAQ